MTDQRTLEESGLPELLGRMTKDAAMKYRGGIPQLDLVKGHPKFVARLHELFDVLAAERAAMIPLLERPVWKTIQLGTHANNKALRQAVIEAGFRISDWADSILIKKTAVATEPTEANLVIVTAAELGFPDGATREKIYDKAISMGFELCPAEVGPQLRLQYPADEQPMNEWLLVAMEPIKASDGSLGVFDVERDGGGAWLGSLSGDPGGVWGASLRWLFRRK
jgi:hypothetical protein